MSLQDVAQLAGVSTSTVSRVLNEHPNVAASTAESVRKVIRELSFTPKLRKNFSRARGQGSLKSGTFAFIVFGTSGQRPTPAFERLLRGVSEQASCKNINLTFSFVSDPMHLPPHIIERRVDGLLLHGERPAPEVQAKLQTIPTVWLMANPQQPAWGDQVMPDNSAIGAMAAGYLLRRGHRRLAYMGTGRSWSLEIRSLAFARAAGDAGAEVDIIEAPEAPGQDFWQRDDLSNAARVLTDRLAESRTCPTGLFIAEDRLVPLVNATMHRNHNEICANQASLIDVISCNNERSHFAGMQSIPATIDIRAEAIGRLGIERLMSRLRSPDLSERIRCMVEPMLVEAES